MLSLSKEPLSSLSPLPPEYSASSPAHRPHGTNASALRQAEKTLIYQLLLALSFPERLGRYTLPLVVSHGVILLSIYQRHAVRSGVCHAQPGAVKAGGFYDLLHQQWRTWRPHGEVRARSRREARSLREGEQEGYPSQMMTFM